jgi:hypothetical protein
MQAEPLIARLQKQAEQVRRRELAQALHHFPAESHEHLDRLTRSLVRKILHYPSSRLRGRGGAEDLPRLDLVRELFQLDEDASLEGLDALGGHNDRDDRNDLDALDPLDAGDGGINAPRERAEDREPR